jgi:hypothetical protein
VLNGYGFLCVADFINFRALCRTHLSISGGVAGEVRKQFLPGSKPRHEQATDVTEYMIQGRGIAASRQIA